MEADRKQKLFYLRKLCRTAAAAQRRFWFQLFATRFLQKFRTEPARICQIYRPALSAATATRLTTTTEKDRPVRRVPLPQLGKFFQQTID